MSNCLGLYIEDNLIKYAKVSKDKEKIKVDSFGIKFFENLSEGIKNVIEESDSQKTPISINLSEELYNYFDMYALLKKNDLDKAIKTEFESYCVDKGYNPNVFETRYAICDNKLDKDKIKIIHIAENKIELEKRTQQLEKYKLTNISPISMSIANLIRNTETKNYLIINIEDITTITTVIDSKITNIDKFEEGSSNILSKLNIKVNSNSKAYEIIKNTTIYTSEGQELQENEENYLEDIMPTLYNISGTIRKKINESSEKIEKIYITGTGSLINNVDLYFQEYLLDVDCEILKPYFVQNTKEIPIKDYIEVNSAISLALMGLGEGISGINFKKQTFKHELKKVDININKDSKQHKKQGSLLKWDLGQKLDKAEVRLLRIAVTLFLLVIIYSGFSVILGNSIESKENEATASIRSTNNQISKMDKDDQDIKQKTTEYETMIKNLEEISNKTVNQTKNAIPNLLNQIMAVIPTDVQLTSIENTTDKHIVIEARSPKYEQLGYFIATLKTDVILQNVISTAGQKSGEYVTIKIEGDLP